MSLHCQSTPSSLTEGWRARNGHRLLVTARRFRPTSCCVSVSEGLAFQERTDVKGESRCALTDAGVASFSGRLDSGPHQPLHHKADVGGPPRAPAAVIAWRALLATAASACILLPGWPVPLPLQQPHPQHPLPGVVTEVLSATLAATPSAIAAEPSSLPSSSSATAAAAKMDAIRQLSSPDYKVMREVSEELSSLHVPPGAATPAPVAAAAAGPTKTPQGQNLKGRLKADDLAPLLGISTSEAKSLVASERELGRVTLGSVTESFDVARELLGLGGDSTRQREQAGRLLVRQPRVLLVPAPELRDRFVELQSLLSVPTSLARRLVASQPGLLTHGSATLRARLSGLCGLFNVDPSLAASLAAHHPGLLAVNSGELADRSHALADELHLTRQQVVAVIRRHPRSLLVPAEAMRSRLRALAGLLVVPRGEALGTLVLNAPRLVLLDEAGAEAALAGLERLLQVTRDHAAEVASEQPVLLVTHGPVLQERLRTLAELANVTLSQARTLATERPSLLTKSSAAMRRAVLEARAVDAGQ